MRARSTKRTRPATLAWISLSIAAAACGAPRVPDSAVPTAPLASAPALAKNEDAGIETAEAAAPAPKPAIATSNYDELLDTIRRGDDRERKKAFDALRQLADPRAANGLVEYLGAATPRWRTQAALALGELGDERAVDALAWRMSQDPLALYRESQEPELRRDDHERVEAARLLGDLVVIHPASRDAIRTKAERGVLAWLAGMPAPHANGMRFLALSGSATGIAKLRAWADPPAPLPKEGSAVFPISFSAAQSALRWLGASQRGAKRDDAIWAILVKQLGRRPVAMDATMDALLQGGTAVRGMAIRALAVGAAQGFAEWGDAKAAPLLLAFVDDAKNNEAARLEAGAALAFTGDASTFARVVDKLKPAPTSDPKAELGRACLLEAFVRRPLPGAGALFSLDEPKSATVLARGGMATSTTTGASAIVAALDDPARRVTAATALLFGGTAEQAALAMAKLDAAPEAEQDEVKVRFAQALEPVTDALYDDGSVARWVRNARARPWAWAIVGRALGDIAFDSGPHTFSRARFRARLLADATQTTDVARREDAVRILQAMGARGELASLGQPLSPL